MRHAIWFAALVLAILTGTPGMSSGQAPPPVPEPSVSRDGIPSHDAAGRRSSSSPLQTHLASRADTLTLAEALGAALEHHPAVGAAHERVEGADAEAQVARAALLPSLAIQSEAVRHELPMVVAPLHGFDPASPPQFDRTLFRSRAVASWTVFDGGAARASVEGREAGHEALSARLEEAETKLIERTTRAYLQVEVRRRVVEAGRKRIQALRAELDRVERHLSEGRAAEVEKLRAEAALREAQAESATAEARLWAEEGTLARLTGRSPEEVSLLELRLPIPRPAGAGQAGPEPSSSAAIAAAQARVKAEEAGVRVARSERLPTAELVGGVSQFGGASSSTTAEWDAGLRISWPLFTGGRRGGMEQAAEARLRQAREELRDVELRLADAASEARAAVEGADARRQALEAAVDVHAEVARIEALALDAGTGVQRDLLEAEASLFRTRAELAEAEAEAIAARVRLAAATGVLRLGWVLDNLEVKP